MGQEKREETARTETAREETARTETAREETARTERMAGEELRMERGEQTVGEPGEQSRMTQKEPVGEVEIGDRAARAERVQRVSAPIIRLGDVRSFGLIGDPGCEGLGTSMMRVYANALETASREDFILVAGDFLPVGKEQYYQAVCGLTNSIASKPVYALRGNHDTGEYGTYFGLHNYALIGDGFTLVCLDNALREFEEEGLDLLRRVLAREDVSNVVVAFHIPLPNQFIGNSVSEEEFGRLREAYGPYRDKLRYFVCGHVHSRFEDVVDGIPMVCSGGGGAMIEDVSEEIKASDVDYHIVRFFVEGGGLGHEVVDLTGTSYVREQDDPILRERLEEAVKGELYAHLKYLSFAERAESRGYGNVANLMRALADSEYRHAKNFFSILEKPGAFVAALEGFGGVERFEHQRLYPMAADYARDAGGDLSRQAFEAAARAEKVHERLLDEARELDGFAVETVYVCPVCGYVVTSLEKLDRCPVCGSDKRRMQAFTAENGQG